MPKTAPRPHLPGLPRSPDPTRQACPLLSPHPSTPRPPSSCPGGPLRGAGERGFWLQGPSQLQEPRQARQAYLQICCWSGGCPALRLTAPWGGAQLAAGTCIPQAGRSRPAQLRGPGWGSRVAMGQPEPAPTPPPDTPGLQRWPQSRGLLAEGNRHRKQLPGGRAPPGQGKPGAT